MKIDDIKNNCVVGAGNMGKQYDAIVIGAGIGGLATALMMSHRGLKTLLLEKHNFVGGRLCGLDKQGFHYDYGVHLISRGAKGPTGEVLRQCGIDTKLEFTKVRPRSAIQGNVHTFPAGFKELVPSADYKGLMQFMHDAIQRPDEEMEEFDHVPLGEHLAQYTQNELITDWIENIAIIYIGAFNSNGSTGEFMRCLKWEALSQSSGYPIGGCDAIAKAYADGIRKLGGEIITGAPVKKIEVSNGVAKGVVVGDTVYKSDLIVSNADIENTAVNLVGAEHYEPDYIEYLKNLVYVEMPFFGGTIRIALDKKLTDIQMLGKLVESEAEENFKLMQQGKVPKGLGAMVVVPSNISPNIAPEGKQYLTLIGFLGRNIKANRDFNVTKEIKETFDKALFQIAEELIPGVHDHTIWSNSLYGEDINNMFGERGAGIGVMQNIDQVGKLRPKIKSPIEGLYIVGGEAGGTGCGVELCINSALEFMRDHCPVRSSR